MKNSKGFTLIELLVVISIISLLSSIVYNSLSLARVRQRDASRKLDLKSFQQALELYYSDHNSYPVTASNECFTSGGTVKCTDLPSSSNWATGISLNRLVSGRYISALPKDPSNDPANWRMYMYKTCPDGQSYLLKTKLEYSNRVTVMANDPGNILLYDVNNDRSVNTADARYAQLCLGSTSAICLFNTDVDFDGQVTMDDLLLIRNANNRRCN